ncbi:MAG TPA: type II toxin-antitoxin system RelE/ParE family toxin [Candidatus Paceibacterota bacterium]
MNPRYSAHARRHIDEIHDYLNERNSEAATHFIAHIRKTAQTLREFPFLGHQGMLPDTREIIVPRSPFVMVHRIAQDSVVILGVYHGAQLRRER